MIESLRAVWQAITLRNLLLLQALGQLAIFLESREQSLFGSWMGHPSAEYVSMALSVFLVIPIALLSDEAVKRGAPARVAYPVAVAMTLPVALLATTVTQQAYLSLLGRPPGTPDMSWAASVSASFQMYVYGAFGMLVFMNQRTADRMLEKVQITELRRAQLEQQLVESRLAAAEAQIDPTLLFNRLSQIKLGFTRGEDDVDAQLNDLIQTLRTALARAASTNERVANEAP